MKPTAASWRENHTSGLSVGKKEDRLKDLLHVIFMLEKSTPAILINCNNQATIAKILSKNHYVKSPRDIELRYKI